MFNVFFPDTIDIEIKSYEENGIKISQFSELPQYL